MDLGEILGDLEGSWAGGPWGDLEGFWGDLGGIGILGGFCGDLGGILGELSCR